MDNMNIRVEGRKMIIEIDLDADIRVTSNGNTMVACTNNWENIRVPGLEAKDDLTFYAGLVRRQPKQGRGGGSQGGRF